MTSLEQASGNSQLSPFLWDYHDKFNSDWVVFECTWLPQCADMLTIIHHVRQYPNIRDSFYTHTHTDTHILIINEMS